MARIVVDVMLKPEILDPQGKAIAEAKAAEEERLAKRRAKNKKK